MNKETVKAEEFDTMLEDSQEKLQLWKLFKECREKAEKVSVWERLMREHHKDGAELIVKLEVAKGIHQSKMDEILKMLSET